MLLSVFCFHSETLHADGMTRDLKSSLRHPVLAEFGDVTKASVIIWSISSLCCKNKSKQASVPSVRASPKREVCFFLISVSLGMGKGP